MSEPTKMIIELPIGDHGASLPPLALTSSWRNYKPVVNLDTCINCGTCVKFCPIGCIEQTDVGVEIDYDFCKGCGICATECPTNSIEWVAEGGEE